MYLLAHWEKPSVFTLSDCDGAVIGHHGWRDADIRRYVLSRPDWLLFDYFNVWQMPLLKWLDGTNPWFEFLGNGEGRHPYYMTPDGRPVCERWKGRPLVPWANIDPQKAADCVIDAKERRNPRGHGGILLDCWFPRLEAWMSPDILTIPPDVEAQHAANAFAFLRLLEAAAVPVLTNGDRNSGRQPVYLEDTGQRIPWDEALAVWRGLSTLSVNADVPYNVALALQAWGTGKWLAFTDGDGTAAPGAYAQALAYRRAYGV